MSGYLHSVARAGAVTLGALATGRRVPQAEFLTESAPATEAELHTEVPQVEGATDEVKAHREQAVVVPSPVPTAERLTKSVETRAIHQPPPASPATRDAVQISPERPWPSMGPEVVESAPRQPDGARAATSADSVHHEPQRVAVRGHAALAPQPQPTVPSDDGTPRGASGSPPPRLGRAPRVQFLNSSSSTALVAPMPPTMPVRRTAAEPTHSAECEVAKPETVTTAERAQPEPEARPVRVTARLDLRSPAEAADATQPTAMISRTPTATERMAAAGSATLLINQLDVRVVDVGALPAARAPAPPARDKASWSSPDRRYLVRV